jgi:hypothetical protein
MICRIFEACGIYQNLDWDIIRSGHTIFLRTWKIGVRDVFMFKMTEWTRWE